MNKPYYLSLEPVFEIMSKSGNHIYCYVAQTKTEYLVRLRVKVDGNVRDRMIRKFKRVKPLVNYLDDYCNDIMDLYPDVTVHEYQVLMLDELESDYYD